MPGLWACVIYGRYACLPSVWGLVVVWVAVSVSGRCPLPIILGEVLSVFSFIS